MQHHTELWEHLHPAKCHSNVFLTLQLHSDCSFKATGDNFQNLQSREVMLE